MIVPSHKYLQSKRLTMMGCAGLKIDRDGNLLIPMWRGDQLVSLQRIAPDGTKKNATGCPAKFATFTIDRPKSVITILVEGFCTGVTVFEAIPTSRVIVCFSAGNLVAVAEHGDWQGMMLIASDDDKWTQEIHGKNPGKEAGEKAAKIIGCGVATPMCDGTDFNDMFCERLEKLEEKEEFKPFKISHSKLRQMALYPIGSMLMKAAKFV